MIYSALCTTFGAVQPVTSAGDSWGFRPHRGPHTRRNYRGSFLGAVEVWL